MATPKFKMLSQAFEAPEEGITYPLGLLPEEQPGLFEDASDAALARENARPKEGYVPAGTGPMVEPSMESPLAPLPSGLRSRKPVEFTPDTAKMQGKLAGFLGGNQPLQGPGYARPLSDKEFASEQERARKLMTQDDASFAQDIPVASAEGSKTLASTVSGSGGDDALDRLSIGQALTRALEGSGSVISGQNLRSGAADTLGDRMKQIEALRAKKAQAEEDRALEAKTWGASNRAALSSALAQWKSDPEKTAALEALASGVDATKQSDFTKNLLNAVMTKPKVLGVEATTKKTGAQGDVAAANAVAIPAKVDQGAGKLAETIRSNKAREEIQRKAILAKQLSDTKANNDVRAAGSDPKQAEKAITDAMKSAEKNDLGIASNIRDFQGLEAVAPGFTQGKVPSWLGQGSIAAAIDVPGLNKQATQLASALELFTAGIRNSLFGASLTGNEKASFDAIVSSGLMMPPDVLAANINRIRQGAAKFAQNHFTVAQELHPEVTGRVLRASPLFGPATREGGVYSDVWMLPAAGGVALTKKPSAAAIAKLEADSSPEARAAYDSYFGAGSAARDLGKGQ